MCMWSVGCRVWGVGCDRWIVTLAGATDGEQEKHRRPESDAASGRRGAALPLPALRSHLAAELKTHSLAVGTIVTGLFSLFVTSLVRHRRKSPRKL